MENFLAVADILKWKAERVLIKINTLFFSNNGNTFLDVFLAVHEGEYKIEFKAEDDLSAKISAGVDSIYLSLPQIEYIIAQLNAFNTARKLSEEYFDFFGIETYSGISKEVGFYRNRPITKNYKILIEYRSHLNGEKAFYNLLVSVAQPENVFSIDFDKFLLNMYLYKDILVKMHSEKGSIASVESIIRVSDRSVIYSAQERVQSPQKANNEAGSNSFYREAGDVILTNKALNIGQMILIKGKSINEIATEIVLKLQSKQLSEQILDKSLSYLEKNIEDSSNIALLKSAIRFYSKRG